MSRSRTDHLGPFGLTIGAVVIALILITFMYASVVGRRRARRVQITVDLGNFNSALGEYSNHFGALPVGDNATVISKLTGSNEQRLMFLRIAAPAKRNSRGEFLDPNGRPYDIEVTTNRVRFTRPSQAKPLTPWPNDFTASPNYSRASYCCFALSC